MTSVADVQLAVESLWPAATAEDWDRRLFEAFAATVRPRAAAT